MIVGIDIGTQSLKAAVTDHELRLRGQAAVSYRPSFPRPGWAEQDCRLWEQALGPAITGVLDAAGTPSDAVRAVGICGQLDGCVAVDRAGTLHRRGAQLTGLPAGTPVAVGTGDDFSNPLGAGLVEPGELACARGCFYGLSAADGRAHLARALLEGCAFAMRDVLERLPKIGVTVGAILLLGGGARSMLWARIRADLTGLPVTLPRIVDTSPIGAAMLAAVAAGLQPSLQAGARLVAGEARTIEPNPSEKTAYDDAYGAYRKLFESLRPMFRGR